MVAIKIKEGKPDLTDANSLLIQKHVASSYDPYPGELIFFVSLSKFRHFEQTSLILITLSLQFPRALYFRPAHSNGKKQPPIAFVPKAQSWLPGLTSVISELWR